MANPSTAKTSRTAGLQLGRLTFLLLEQALVDADATLVHLRPQSLKVLQVLAERHGQVVSKDALIEAVWPNLTVSDDSLTQCVADIRKALGDKNRTILRTIPKFGYALHAAPDESNDENMSDDPGSVELYSDTPQAMVLIAPVPETLPLGAKGQFLDQIDQNVDHSVTPTTRTADGVHLTCANVQEAVTLALRALSMVREHYGVGTCVKIGICLVCETNGAIDDKLKDIAFFPGDRMTSSIVLSRPAREHLKLNIYYDIEDLGTASGAILGRTIRAFKITDRPDLAPSPITRSDDVLATVAVIPLSPRTPEIDKGMMGEMIAGDIISELSPSAELRVIARMSTANLRVEEADLNSIASRLKANFVVAGGYAISGTNLRMNLELSDVTNQTVLWSERVDVAISEVTQGVAAIEQVGARIRRAISVHEARRALRFPLHSLQNYTLLVSAINLMHRLSKADFLKARDILQELVRRCPGHPEPLAWIGRWHVLRVQQGWANDLKQESDLALAYTARALAIDPDSSLSLSSEGAILVNLSHDLDTAEQRYSAALECNPNDSYCRLLRGTLYAFQGKGELAQSDCELSLRLAPNDPHRFLYLGLSAGACIAARDYERAMELAKASYRLNRCHASTLRILAVAQLRTGQKDDAIETAQELMRLQPDLHVQGWLDTSPSGRYEIGQEFAGVLRELGVPK